MAQIAKQRSRAKAVHLYCFLCQDRAIWLAGQATCRHVLLSSRVLLQYLDTAYSAKHCKPLYLIGHLLLN
jgi:hypothetical protein